MLWSVFWGLLRLFFRACDSTYIHTCKFCCRLRLAVSEKYDVRGALNLSRSINAKQKSRLTWNQQYSETTPLEKVGWDRCEWWTRSYLNEFGVPLTLMEPRANLCPPFWLRGNFCNQLWICKLGMAPRQKACKQGMSDIKWRELYKTQSPLHTLCNCNFDR